MCIFVKFLFDVVACHHYSCLYIHALGCENILIGRVLTNFHHNYYHVRLTPSSLHSLCFPSLHTFCFLQCSVFKCTLFFFSTTPQKASMHFQHDVPQYIPEKRYYMDRYATNRSQYLFRGQPGSNPVCWLGDQWQRHPPEQHNTSRLGASLPWGPEKMGEICCWVRAYG